MLGPQNLTTVSTVLTVMPQMPSFQFSDYTTSESWAPRVFIQARKCHDYRFQLLRAGMHSLVLTSFSFHVHSRGGSWYSVKGYPM